jgi:hypothetical protein
MPYIDREYQRQAILAVERGIASGERARSASASSTPSACTTS